MLSKLLSVAVSHSFLPLYRILLFDCRGLFIHSTVGGYLSHFQFFAIKSSACCVCPLGAHVQWLLQSTHWGVGYLGHSCTHAAFLGHSKPFSKVVEPICAPTAVRKCPICSAFLPTCCQPFTFCSSGGYEMSFFLCLLAVWGSSSVKCLFKSFLHFLFDLWDCVMGFVYIAFVVSAANIFS